MVLDNKIPPPPYGFLGLGTMGYPMLLNLLKAGYQFYVYDIIPERIEAAVKSGAIGTLSAVEVVTCCNVIMLSLSTSETFVQVAEELLPQIREGQIFIDLGTTTPPETRRLATEFSLRGAILLDIPVSGRREGAELGNLRMFAAGDKTTIECCKPLLEIIGDPQLIVYCGMSGSGQIVKGVNQIMMALGNAAYLEALAFGVRSGIQIEQLYEAVGGTERWRQDLGIIAQRIIEGKGEYVGVKFRELPYFLREAQEKEVILPLCQTLFTICNDGDRVVIDDNQPAPSFWHELMKGRLL